MSATSQERLDALNFARQHNARDAIDFDAVTLTILNTPGLAKADPSALEALTADLLALGFQAGFHAAG